MPDCKECGGLGVVYYPFKNWLDVGVGSVQTWDDVAEVNCSSCFKENDRTGKQPGTVSDAP